MAVTRNEKPYMQFNFRVEVGGAEIGGFQEVSGMGTEIASTEYREGNDKDNNVRKLSGLNKVSDITLKRGAMGSDFLFKKIDDVRTGKSLAGESMKISLMSEDRTKDTAVMTWQLKNAKFTSLKYGPFNASASGVAMEEAVVTFERLSLE